jgi:hypothetical protein
MSRNQYDLVQDFPGYRAREEATKLKPGYLVYPSQNVTTNVSGRVQSVGGYAVDGDESLTADNGIQGSYDFDNKRDTRRNIRAAFLSSAGNDGKVQFRYKASDGTVTWKDVLTTLANTSFSFTTFWDTTDLLNLCLFVNGDGNVYEWNGAATTILSTGVNTLTKNGTNTWQQDGFYTTRNRSYINTRTGVVFTSTGGEGTTTLTGVTPNPAVADIVAGDVFIQQSVTTAVSTFAGTGVSTFNPTLIKRGINNQIYMGSSSSNQVFVSKVNNFKDYSYTTPIRVVGEGYLYNLDAPPRAFIPQETGSVDSSSMLISAGRDYWYRELVQEEVNATAGTATERLILKPLRTGRMQGALSEHCTSRVKNGVAFLGNDNVINILGQVSNQYVPQLDDISYSIINDMVGYNLTGASVFYHRNFIYLAVPLHGIIRAYNMTDTERQYWEAPIQYPIVDFYVTEDGEIGGHGYAVSESYLLFTGNRFRANNTDEGFAIPALAVFAPNTHNSRTKTKTTEEIWIDGLLSTNATLASGYITDLDGCQSTKTKNISGSDTTITCSLSEGGAFGDSPFGTQILGDGLVHSNNPPYFNVMLTFDKTENAYRFEQVFFYSNGIDYEWQIISFGTDSLPTIEDNNDIRQ